LDSALLLLLLLLVLLLRVWQHSGRAKEVWRGTWWRLLLI
jgi:hypothetical protein